MIFFSAHSELVNFEEEEEGDALDDSLLGELVGDDLEDDLEDDLDPLLKESAFDVLTEETDAIDPLDAESKFFDEDEEEEEDMDYDSFDDEDEL